MAKQNDFSKGPVWKNIVVQAVPLTIAQLVQLLYNIVDRVYIGHLPGTDNLALTGIGLTFPIVSIIAAFTNMFGSGGVPLFAMARGGRDEKQAERIMGNVFHLILLVGAVLMVVGFCFRKPILYLFGASDDSYIYADQYLQVYLLGTIFSMITTGMNGFINAQGFPKIGMTTTLLGAIMNLILDPIFIFGFHMGVRGAALATVLSQFASAIWVLRFLTSDRSALRLKKTTMKLDFPLIGRICSLGMSGFIMMFTNALVQIVCNSALQTYGGDLYVGIMTILNSVREVLSLPVHGISTGSQPVISFNYGAKDYKRVKEGIRFSAYLGVAYTFLAWALVFIAPRLFIRIFSSDAGFLDAGPQALKAYFFGFCFMAFQFVGQQTFQSMGFAKRAIFFSLLRKVIIVVPLTLLLPRIGMGVYGVFWAEPISNLLGGLASFLTMYFTVYRKLPEA